MLFNDTATTEIYTLSLHDALPIFFVFVVFSASLDARVAALDLPPEAQQQLGAQKGNLGAAQVPKGLSGETAAAVQRAIEESFVAGFRIAMFVAAGPAPASAAARGNKGRGEGK